MHEYDSIYRHHRHSVDAVCGAPIHDLSMSIGAMLSMDRSPVGAVYAVCSVDVVHGITIQDLLVSSKPSINLYYHCYTTYDSVYLI